jgi:hypothetical protein
MIEQWQREFIAQLRMGVPAEKACRSAAGRSLQEVLQAKDADPIFSNAWDAVSDPEAGRGKSLSRTLAGETLEALLWAQCSDEQSAAYFNLEVPEFLAAIERDPELKRIHKLARMGGQAQLKVYQMNEAASGNGQMQMFLGKQYVGQADKVDTTVKHEMAPMDTREMAKRLLFILRENNMEASDFIDVDAVEVAEIPALVYEPSETD